MIRFGVFTDLHYGFIPDGDRRIHEILESFEKEKLNFIVFLGDLCYPEEKNKGLVERLRSYPVPFYYVIGNHDADKFSQSQVAEFFRMKALNYSFLVGDTKFIVLNTCYMKKTDGDHPFSIYQVDRDYDTYPVLPDVEMQWLKDEIKDENLQYVVFSHHSLANDHPGRGIANRAEVQKLLHTRKTILAMNGHDHGDDCRVIDNIPYYTLNSCSYIWHGIKQVSCYPEEIHKKQPFLDYIIPYKTAFYSVVEIDHENISIRGMKGEYLNITPEDVGINDRRWNGVSIEPVVSEYIRQKKG